MTQSNTDGVLSLNRQYTLQDGKMNSITVSESNIDDSILITQLESTLNLPRRYITDVIEILKHIRDEPI
jgi:DNA helicase IV